MSLRRNICAFSRNGGEYLAYSSPDGCLKIWETSTSILKQEYTPSSHLSATCSCLVWGPTKQNTHVPKKSKKSRGSSTPSLGDLQLVAMGTMTGDILLYSFSNADLYTSLAKGHSSIVNDVCWYEASNSLFSCSNDQHIVIWDITSGKIKTKWKADKTSIHSICVIDANNMLSAGHTILWWDIKQMSVIKSFSGHGTEIFRLLPLVDENTPNSYFLSAAVGDRVINVWQLEENKTKGSVASFVSTSEPTNIDVFQKYEKPINMSVVTKDGIFHFYEHQLNGKLKTPLQPKFSIQVASKANDPTGKPRPVPILTANISDGLDSCLLTYGSFIRPVFERISISDISTDQFLIRDLFSSAVSAGETISRIKQTEKPKNVKVLAPGHMGDVAPTVTSKKRKQKGVDVKELPMEERLKALELSKIPKNLSGQEPGIKSDSMVQLLLQGLQSKDKCMLNSVLQCGDESVIQNTLQRLPLQSIFAVLRELFTRLTRQEQRHHPYLRWLNALLAVHLPYLMSCKDIDEYLGPISQIIEARVENFYKMSQLQGCLKILLTQTTSPPNYSEPSTQPLVEYHSDSSDESDSEEGEASEASSDDEQIAQESTDEDSESESDMES